MGKKTVKSVSDDLKAKLEQARAQAKGKKPADFGPHIPEDSYKDASEGVAYSYYCWAHHLNDKETIENLEKKYPSFRDKKPPEQPRPSAMTPTGKTVPKNKLKKKGKK